MVKAAAGAAAPGSEAQGSAARPVRPAAAAVAEAAAVHVERPT